MKNEIRKPTAGMVEPDFLKYLEDTFKRWKQLWEDGVTLGTREIGKFESVCYGAKINAHTGFFAIGIRDYDQENDREHYTYKIYKNQREFTENQAALYEFETPIFG